MTDYHKSFIPRVRDLGYLGATDAEIANMIGVSVTKLRQWLEQYPEFAAAYDDGKLHASAKVAASLFKRAVGYDVMKVRTTPQGTIRETVHIEPSVPACIFWLTNKRPEQWKSKVEHELPGGVSVTDALSDIESARRIAFALAKAMNQSVEDQQRSIEHGQRSESEAE